MKAPFCLLRREMKLEKDFQRRRSRRKRGCSRMSKLPCARLMMEVRFLGVVFCLQVCPWLWRMVNLMVAKTNRIMLGGGGRRNRDSGEEEEMLRDDDDGGIATLAFAICTGDGGGFRQRRW